VNSLTENDLYNNQYISALQKYNNLLDGIAGNIMALVCFYNNIYKGKRTQKSSGSLRETPTYGRLSFWRLQVKHLVGGVSYIILYKLY
jgi:hypothetical protein